METKLGANLPPNFPVIDRFANGVATSIKSIDLNSAIYQDTGRLSARINAYSNPLAGFDRADLGGRRRHRSLHRDPAGKGARAITRREADFGRPRPGEKLKSTKQTQFPAEIHASGRKRTRFGAAHAAMRFLAMSCSTSDAASGMLVPGP